MLNKTSYQDFKKPLILGSGVQGVLPSVVFLGCLFRVHSLPGSSLYLWGNIYSSSKIQTKKGLLSKEKPSSLLWRQKCTSGFLIF